MPTSRDMWRIAAPMILSNVSVPLLGMVDTGVTGHLDSPAYLGAVAIGGTIFTFLYLGMNFLRNIDFRIDFDNQMIVWNP